MIGTIASVLVIAAGQTPAQTQAATAQDNGLTKGSQLISTMLAKYHDAKTLSAKIHMTQSALGQIAHLRYRTCLRAADEIYFTQKRSDNSDYKPILVSDGITFEYTAESPLDRKTPRLFRETTHPKQGDLHIDEMWANVKPTIKDGDYSFALGALISRNFDLKSLIAQMVTCENKGKVQIGNRLANDIEGVWKSEGYGQTGTYQIYITDDGDLVRQVVTMSFQVSQPWLIKHKLSPTAYPDGIQTVTTWDVTADVNQPLDDSIFKLAG